jgi:hypothetical protein
MTMPVCDVLTHERADKCRQWLPSSAPSLGIENTQGFVGVRLLLSFLPAPHARATRAR